MSAPAAFGVLHIAGLVAEFHRLHPAVTIELGLNDRVVDLLEERWDMAIRIGKLADSSLVVRKLADVRLNVCASPNYLAERGTPHTLDDLADHDCLGYTLFSLASASVWSFGQDGGTQVPIKGPLRANNGGVLAQAAIAGQGLVYGPRFITAAALADGGLVEVTFDVPLMKLGAIHAITHAARKSAATMRIWIDSLSARLRVLSTEW